jgi:hypothetical protein
VLITAVAVLYLYGLPYVEEPNTDASMYLFADVDGEPHELMLTAISAQSGPASTSVAVKPVGGVPSGPIELPVSVLSPDGLT